MEVPVSLSNLGARVLSTDSVIDKPAVIQICIKVSPTDSVPSKNKSHLDVDEIILLWVWPLLFQELAITLTRLMIILLMYLM